MNGLRHTVRLKKLVSSAQAPACTRMTGEGALFVDFGRAAFGTLSVPLPAGHQASPLVVHLGEKLGADGRLDRNPPGTIRYRRIEQPVVAGQATCRLLIPPDGRNTGPEAIRMPDDIGEVMPFRYAEIEEAAAWGLVEPAAHSAIRQLAVHYPFDDAASAFTSSSEVLDAVWELCKYSIKATTFCGVYVDGDRERIPYEGDAYINQLGHYGVDREYDFARYSHEVMIQKPTWCTEWHLHSVMMAWMDYLYTGETASLEMFYDELCAKTLIDFARADGLISVAPELRTPEMTAKLARHFASGIIKENIRDVVDWPPGSFTDGGTGERDNHDMRPVNTVVNAFHCHALELMSQIAAAVGRPDDQARFATRAEQVRATIQQRLFDPERGLYVDGEGSPHASLHSNMFMLAFGLVPEPHWRKVIDFVKSRGMACSVYGAQHLLEALYLNGEGECGLELMTAQHDRSWWNMIQVGSTMTLEAWDLKYKKNLDWNHAWGAAPANIIPRYVLGVRPLVPGFSKILIQPQPGTLAHATGTVPTYRGPVKVAWTKKAGGPFRLEVDIPPGVKARVGVPQPGTPVKTLVVDGCPMPAKVVDGYLFVEGIESGHHRIEAIGEAI